MSPTEHLPHNAGVAGSSPAPATDSTPVPTSGYASGGAPQTETRRDSGTPSGAPASRVDRPRKLKPNGPERVGYLSEIELAARWGRAHNTLSSWRTRPHPDLEPLQWVVIDGCVYYSVLWLLRYEQRKESDAIRPAKLRGTPFPAVPFWPPWMMEYHGQTIEAAISQRKAKRGDPEENVQPELPLRMTGNVSATATATVGAAATITHTPERQFQSVTISAGYALAIATDGTAWFAPVLGGLEYITWKPIAALPQSDHVAQLFARRAA